jgi:hypothetical protein
MKFHDSSSDAMAYRGAHLHPQLLLSQRRR